MKTMKQLASDALAVQNACNLSGVVISFGNGIKDLRANLEAEGKGGTDAVNEHPYCVLFTTQILWLSCSGSIDSEKYSKAYAWANAEAAKPDAVKVG
jgi:hypothetical protein